MTREQIAFSARCLAKSWARAFLRETDHGYLSGSYSASALAFKQVEYMLKGRTLGESTERARKWLKRLERK